MTDHASVSFWLETAGDDLAPRPPLDGTTDAVLHPFSGDGSRYMEYVTDHGHFDDFPFDVWTDAVRSNYPAMAGALPTS